MIKTFYKVLYDSNGKFVAVYETESGLQLNLDEEDDPLTIKLREKEAELGSLDLSDLAPIEEPLLKNYRLNFLVESDRAYPLFRYPGDINYNTGLLIGLSTKTIDYFGLRVANIYEQLSDVDTHERLPSPNSIVYERYKYIWNEETGLPLSRIKEIQFYFEDGTKSERVKLLPKEFYNTSDRENITYQRRKTIVSWLIARSKELGLGNALIDFFGNFKDECDRYILYGDRSIIYLINSSNEPWLDADTTTEMGRVRESILLCFDKALSIPSEEEIDNFLARNAI